MKQCTNCGNTKPFNKFSKKKAALDGYTNKCKDCHNEYVRTLWYPKNRKKQIESSIRYKKENKFKYLANKYNTSEIIIKNLFKRGKCKICNSSKKLVVYHCHKTNKIRGVLCAKCNSGLGFFRDNPKFLKEAIKYLAR